MLDKPGASSSFVKNPFRASKPFHRRGFCLEGFWSLRPHRGGGYRPFKMSRCSLQLVVALLLMGVHGYAEQPLSLKDCQHRLKEAQKLGTVAPFARYSGVADFIDAVKASDIGQTLARCRDQFDSTADGAWKAADAAWKSILEAVHKTGDEGPTFQVDMHTALLLVVFTEHMTTDQVHNLKAFIGQRPWKMGFSFASSIAVDALLARKNSRDQDTVYHSYTPAQMEAVVHKYVEVKRP